MARTKKLSLPTCEWRTDSDCWGSEYYDTACGHAHQFIDAGPRENSYAFCPYCGRPLKAKCHRGA